MKLIRNSFLVILLVFVTISCNSSKKESNKNLSADVLETKQNEALILLRQNCYICHSVTAKSHDEIIAPPMEVIKRRYKMKYPSKDEFVVAFTSWVLDPTEDKALMYGAVNKFNVMPKLPNSKNEIALIADYIFENELESPQWFETHFKEEHPNGFGMGQGKRNKQH